MKLAVLGAAGLMGRGIVRDLLWDGSEGVEKVVATDIGSKQIQLLLDDLNDVLPNDRLVTQALDVRNHEEMADLLKSVDVCINNVSTLLGYQMDIFKACLEVGCAYIDLGGLGFVTEKQLEMRDEFAKAGVPALLGLGSAPGLTNVLAKCCSEQLDTIEKVNLNWVGKIITSIESPVFTPPYSNNSLVAEFADYNRQFLDGQLKEVPPMSGQVAYDLPEPFGRCVFSHTIHSETTTIPFSKGFKDKGIKEVTWRLCLPQQLEGVMSSLMRVGFGDKEPLVINGTSISPLAFLAALIDRNIDKNKDKIPSYSIDNCQDYNLLFAVGEGKKNDEELKATIMCYIPVDVRYSPYIDAPTSMCASIGGQMLGKGEIPPGVWPPEEVVNTERFFGELKKRGFQFTIKKEQNI